MIGVDILIRHPDDRDRVVQVAIKSAKLGIGDGWQLPGGKVEDGESLRLAAIRELREETGILVAADDAFTLYDGLGIMPGWWIHTFSTIPFSCEPRQMEPDLPVRWGPLADVLNGPFGPYYRRFLR